MSKRELIDRELDRLPEQDLGRLLAFVQSLKEAHAEAMMSTLIAESALAKDWLTPEEDAGLDQFVNRSPQFPILRSQPDKASARLSARGVAGADVILCQITSQARSDIYSVALDST